MNDALRSVQALRLSADDRASLDDRVIVEAPIALLYNGDAFAVMMATPESLEDFALGFALSEGIVGEASEFALVDVVRHEEGVALHAAIPQARFDALAPNRGQQRRLLAALRVQGLAALTARSPRAPAACRGGPRTGPMNATRAP